MTVQDILYDARALIDEYAEEGVVISPDEVATIEANGLRFINMAVQEDYATSRRYEEYSLVLKRVENLLGNQYHVEEFTGEDTYYPNENGVVGAKSYFFTVDSDATVLIQEYNGSTWNTLQFINIAVSTETDYKGLITPTDASYPIRLTFSGTTYYRHLNRALWGNPYKESQIPSGREWRRYEMPSNFGFLSEIVSEAGTYDYQIKANTKWEGYNILAIRDCHEGTIKVIYNPIPDELTAKTDTVPVYNPISQQFIKYYVAAKLATTENTDLVSFFEQKANELKLEANRQQPASEESIQDVYFQNSGYYYNGEYYGRV